MNRSRLEQKVINEFKFYWLRLDYCAKEHNHDGAWNAFLKLNILIDLLDYIYPDIDTFMLWKKAFDKTR